MALRKIGDRVALTPKALKLRPDLRGEVGTIIYRPLITYPRGLKRGRVMYSVDFGRGDGIRKFGAYADQIQSARR